MEGSALIQAGTEKQNVAAGEVFTTAAGQRMAQVAVRSPRPQAKFLNNGEAAIPVSFEWNRIGFSNSDNVRLEIAEDRSFSRPVLVRESSADTLTVNVTNGVYYWRAYPESEAELKQGGVSGRLAIVYAPPPRLVSPVRDERFSFKTARPGVRFQWTAGAGATAYVIEVAANADMRDPVYRSSVQTSGDSIASVVYAGLDSGIWYWRVRPVYPRDYEGTAPVSETASFTVERVTELAAPQPQNRQETVYLEQQGNNYFSWQVENEAASYTFLLSQQEDLSNPLIQKQVRDNYYALDVKAVGLAPGQYYWGVYQTDIEENNSGISAVRTLVVMAGSPSERIVPSPEKPAPVQVIAETIVPAAVSPTAVSPAVVPAQPETPAPLAAPRNLRPAAGYTLTEAIIIRDRQVVFSWDAVTDAAEYTFTLFHVTAGNNTEVLRQTLSRTSYTLTNLALLDAGRFVWQVEAAGAGRKSAAAESRFTVDITEIEGTQGQETGVLFGTN
jgi:hypothetical protein